MSSHKIVFRLLFFICWLGAVSPSLGETATTIDQSVARALNHSPQLRALKQSHEAITFDLKKARAGYGPSLDLELGYGVEQYSDKTTRQPGADPSDTDWDSRSEVALKLIQKIYDGGETGRQVAIREASLGSSQFLILNATDAIALDAISAHLNVCRQRELVALAQKNLKVHQDIYQYLAERERAGAGSIADVTQTQARMARAQSQLYVQQAGLSRTIANYVRVVGSEPAELAYALAPEKLMPGSMEQALNWTEQGNPELMALNAALVEASERVALARSAYKPKVNIELSSRYNDQLEADPSWKNSNEAMLMLRWNLFNGGQDRAGVNAALSREHESRSNRDDKLIELQEATSSAWATYLSLQREKKAYLKATTYSRETFEAYLSQFSISKRSLLDVLNTQRDYFQSASQLVSVSADETVAAYRILELAGKLRIPEFSSHGQYPEALRELSQSIDLSAAIQADHLEPQAWPAGSTESPTLISAVHEKNRDPGETFKTNALDELSQQYAVKIGPFVNSYDLKMANEILHNGGIDFRKTQGAGIVKFTRLLVGLYSPDEARRRLEDVKKVVDSAFVLAEGGQLALYAGSFFKSERALRQSKLLEREQINVSPVETEIKMQGPMLVVKQVDRHTAEWIAGQMSHLGLSTEIITRSVN